MADSPYLSEGVATYPSHFIDPRSKGYEWILGYSKAAFRDSRGFMPFNQLITGNMKMAEIKMYVLGKQPVDKYKKMSSPGVPTDQSWRSVDWTPPAFMCKYRNISISKLLQKKFDFDAYAIDPLARSQEDEYFNRMKVKILMREQAQKMGSPLADNPELAPQPGEPLDMEQLKMQREYTYKHAMALHAEQAISLIFGQNNIDEIRKQVVTSAYDYGIGAYTQWIDENGMVKQRPINMEYFGCSYFEKPDGSDMVHWFEIVPTFIADLAPYYTKDQLDDICKKAVGKYGNPGTYLPTNNFVNPSWNRFKVMVMQIKFLSWNDTVYKNEIDKNNNERFGKSSYANKQFLAVNDTGQLEEKMESVDNTTEDYFESLHTSGKEGQPKPKYINSSRKISYKASWVIDTDYMHDWGLRENQNRKLSSWWDTDLDIQLYAPNFYKMQFTGISEQLIPFEDKACQIWFNLQNLSNKLIPYLVNMDMTTIEGSFPFGKAGDKGKPSEVIDFIYSNFVVPYRSGDIHRRNPNYKPVTIEASGQLHAFGVLHEELARTLEYMRQVAGLNEVTDASTINERNLNSTNEAMVESTNNALYLISDCDKDMLRRTADAVVQKVQIAVGLGKVEGYAKALGSTAVQFFQINPAISLHELGIMITEAPTQQERQMLWQDLTMKDSQGLITPGDKHFIMTCRNLTQAYSILDYNLQKRKEEAQQFALQQTQAGAEANGRVAQQIEQMKQHTIQMQGEIDMQLLIVGKQLEYKIEEMKKSMDLEGETRQVAGRIDVGRIAAEAKVISEQLAVGSQLKSKQLDAMSNLIGKGIDADANIEKQKIANKKPVAKAKS